ncbi:MAG: hypothetical protein KJ712_03945 [Bacteroidetes bacterium]|nr:hypothetical protein [Bacteroidota bacterium]MBU2266549.1 hypothetical protein [Bacteroidota bacterium]
MVVIIFKSDQCHFLTSDQQLDLHHYKTVMKKLLAVFLLIAYSAAASGVTLNYHYCGEQLSNVSLINFSNKVVCLCNPDMMPKGCCQDKVVYHKTDNHKNLLNCYDFNKLTTSGYLTPATDHQNYSLSSVNYDLNYPNNRVRHSKPLAIFLAIQSILI